MDGRRVNQVVDALNAQREKIQSLHNEYSTGYDAAFDQHNAIASVQRWSDRATKVIQVQRGQAEAAKFRHALSSAPKGRGSWHWRELCEYFDTYLMRLIEDVEENPDDLNDAVPSQTATSDGTAALCSTRQHDVFLSYSAHDKDEAREIYNALTKVGKKCFLAEKNLQPGDRFDDEIRDSIVASKEAWILVSPSSISSAWVQREASAAWVLKKRIVPIMLRCGPSDLPEFLAVAHAIDFHKVFPHIKQLR